MSAHTPGPWRWEINRSAKILHLVGGRPKYDLTIMDFDRWGMSRAVATLRDPAHDGMNIMHRLPDRQDWIVPFPGREHHADWCAAVKHPDMQLIAAAPDLLEAAKLVIAWYEAEDDHSRADFYQRIQMCRDSESAVRAAIAKATGAK